MSLREWVSYYRWRYFRTRKEKEAEMRLAKAFQEFLDSPDRGNPF